MITRDRLPPASLALVRPPEGANSPLGRPGERIEETSA